MGTYYLLRERGKELARVKKGAEGYSVDGKASTFFPDLIFSPHFMVTQEGATVMDLYMPDINMSLSPIKNIRDKGQHVYFRVQLPLVKGLSEKTVYDKSGLYIEKFVLDSEAIYNLPLLEIRHIQSTYIFARLDIVESLLRRGMSGFSVEKVEVV